MKKKKIIGREREIAILEQAWQSKEAEFIALYGRRRVGKTHLIREYFSHKKFYMEVAGRKKAPLTKQIEQFMRAISTTFCREMPLRIPKTWDEAFDLLRKEMERIPQSQKIVIFLDELPWMATKKSGLIQAIDYHWNVYWNRMPNVIVIVCGSAASWMLENLIHAKGGLHNRLTRRMKLDPYNLRETKAFLAHRGVKLNDKQTLDLYMVMGGIPYYLKEVEKGQSAAQTIDRLCFQKNGLLLTEFTQLFQALFDHAEVNETIIRTIAGDRQGISREKLIQKSGIPSGGTLKKRINELEASGFIQSFTPYGHKKRDQYYRVIDEYTLFYLKWIEPLITTSPEQEAKGYWENIQNTPETYTWAGYSFETVCLKHIEQIRKALHLDKIALQTGSWRHIPRKGAKEMGAQIDLLTRDWVLRPLW